MKKQLFAAITVTALALPVLAQAQAENIYIGGNLGRSELSVSAPEFKNEQNKTSYKIYAGYDFNTNFGMEAGYADFGSMQVNDYSEKAKVDSTAFYAAATASLPLNTQFSLFGKLGASRNQTKIKSSDVGGFSEKQNKTSVLIGFGLNYAINKNLAAVAEYENFGKTFKIDDGPAIKAHTMSAGLRYKF